MKGHFPHINKFHVKCAPSLLGHIIANLILELVCNTISFTSQLKHFKILKSVNYIVILSDSLPYKRHCFFLFHLPKDDNPQAEYNKISKQNMKIAFKWD